MSETPTERNRRIFEEATGSGEPVFVIRAKDILGPAAILAYASLADDTATPEFMEALHDLEGEFHAWRAANPDEIKVPDLRK